MDFSKNGSIKKQQQIKSVSRKFASKVGVSLFRVFLVSLVSLAIIGSIAGFGILKGLADSAPDIDKINVEPTGFTTNVLDKDGNIIQTLYGAEANRVYATIDEIPEVVRNCFISIEDERFYEHKGIDVQGIFRVVFQGIKQGNFDAGASTLTQQLIKNQVFDGGAEDNFTDRFIRKIQEQYLAIQLENKLDKNSILEYYLNTINLGAGTYGVQTASERYFGKKVSQLNLSEAAVIAAIAKSPTNMNPITNPENNAGRRASILENMKRLGHCTEEEYTEALNDDVYSRIQDTNEEQSTTSYYSYFVDELIEQILEDLQEEKGYTSTQATNALYRGGLTIFTTQDSKVQNILDDVYNDKEYFPEMGKGSYWELSYKLSIKTANGETIHYQHQDFAEYFNYSSPISTYFNTKKEAEKNLKEFKTAKIGPGDVILGENINLVIQPQSSMVIMDQSNGHVVAMIGGRGKKTGSLTLNRATNRKRQPGSTFKILSTYLPALDSAGMTLATAIDDAQFKYPDSDKYVRNWNGESYEGLTTLRRGIYRSMNIVTVKTLAQVTPQVAFDYLKRLGFTTLVDSRTDENGHVFSDINLSLGLGGITDGVTNLESTAAFAAIANNGVYTKPILYTKVCDRNGKVLLENKPETDQVMKESTAFLLTNAMEDVVKIGTGTALRFPNIKMPIAGKTGTTSNNIDLWFSGFTPYYTASIWSGFDNNLSQTDKSYHKKIWRDVMERIHQEYDLETVPFTKPDSIVSVKICTKSGKKAVDGLCDKYVGGSTVRTEYFAKGSAPTEKCDVHVKVPVCEVSGEIANDLCPESSLKEAVYLIKEETSKTGDTPYILPKKKCSIHVPGYVFDDEPDEDYEVDVAPTIPPNLPPFYDPAVNTPTPIPTPTPTPDDNTQPEVPTPTPLPNITE